MSSSDEDYVADDSDDAGSHQVSSRHGTRSQGPVKGPAGTSTRGGDPNAGTRKRAAWEDIQRSWDTVVESADGSITAAVEKERNEKKRGRLLRDTTPLQRGIIRHLILVIDLSFAMQEKDLRPTRYLLTLRFAVEFVTEFFEQNPISQLGIIGMRDGIALRISDISGNPTEHIEHLRALREQEPKGNPSLQNALEMSRAALYHAPSHGTREVLIIYGALLSSDPGDIHDTIANLITERIRVSIIGLAAQVAICSELCKRTNSGDDGNYNVILDDVHFRELLLAKTTPPITQTKQQSQSSLLMMGFPSRVLDAGPIMSLCACHSKLTRGGYLCSRCDAKVCSLPAECPACGLTLILSTHLARSYHHLFPLKNWIEIPWPLASQSKSCFSCQTPFPKPPRTSSHLQVPDGKGKGREGVVRILSGERKQGTSSESGRYGCEVCGRHFCIDCDLFAHEVVHNCPGCQGDSRGNVQVRDRDVEMGGS